MTLMFPWGEEHLVANICSVLRFYYPRPYSLTESHVRPSLIISVLDYLVVIEHLDGLHSAASHNYRRLAVVNDPLRKMIC